MPAGAEFLASIRRNSLEDARADPITDVLRDEKYSPLPLPLPMRYGMKPPKSPAYGIIGVLVPMPEKNSLADPP
jgi:hypothetical protein